MPKKQTSAPQPAFFETTPLKLAILSICTFGVYEIYWFYKMWRRAFPKGNKFAAIVRALFCRIFLYQLLKSHQLPHAIWLAIAYFAVGFAIQLPTFWGVVLSYLTFVPLVHVQMQLNKRLKKPVKAPFTWRSIMVAIVGVILSILFFALASGYNASADQNSATTAPTATHKVAKETTKDKPADTAQSATSADSSDDSSDGSSTASKAATKTSTTTSRSGATSGNPASGSSSTPTTPDAPAVNPNATFSIVLGSGYKDTATGHLITPFTIVHEPGHTKSVTASAYASYGTPDTECVATLNGNSGVLDMWFTAPTSPGFYVCTITATDGVTTQTADLPIDTYSN